MGLDEAAQVGVGIEAFPASRQTPEGRDATTGIDVGLRVLRRTFAFDAWTEEELERFLERHGAFFPQEFLMLTFLDNHDMDRFLYIAQGNRDALRRAAAVQMRLPGPPVIYYGTEVGLSQTGSTKDGLGLHVSRVPMAWGEVQDRELLTYYQALIQERRNQRPARR